MNGRKACAAQELPLEILAEIFERCSPENAFEPNSNLPPLVFCYVCRSWRKASQSAFVPKLSMELQAYCLCPSAGTAYSAQEVRYVGILVSRAIYLLFIFGMILV